MKQGTELILTHHRRGTGSAYFNPEDAGIRFLCSFGNHTPNQTCHITEEHNVNNQCHDNLKSHIWHHKATLNIKISSWQWEKDAEDVGITCQ